MKTRDERNRRVDALRELMERFDAPDLTLAEAKGLRSRLAALLEPEGPQGTPTERLGLARPRLRSRAEEWRDALRLTVFSPCAVG